MYLCEYIQDHNNLFFLGDACFINFFSNLQTYFSDSYRNGFVVATCRDYNHWFVETGMDQLMDIVYCCPSLFIDINLVFHNRMRKMRLGLSGIMQIDWSQFHMNKYFY
jgi:hypothetical protein